MMMAQVISLLSDDREDARLVERALQGDRQVMGRIWDRHAQRARATLQRLLGPGPDIEDHLQEVFLRLSQSMTRLLQPSSLRSYITGIAIRVASGELRRRRFLRWLQLTPEGVVPDEPVDGADYHLRRTVARLFRILDTLDTRSRTAFVLRHAEGMEIQEVAAALGVSPTTVKRLVHKATVRVMAQAQRDPTLMSYLEDTRHRDIRRHHDHG